MALQWYYASQGKQWGPIADPQLRQMIATRALQPTDMVWTQGWPQWVPAGSVPSLFPPAPTRPAPTRPAPMPGAAPVPGQPAAFGFRAPASAPGPGPAPYEYDDYPDRPRRKKKRGTK